MAQTQIPLDPTTPDPTATLVSTSSLDFLLIELVPMAYRITADLALREEEEYLHGGVGAGNGAGPSNTSATTATTASTSGAKPPGTDNDASSTMNTTTGIGAGAGTGAGAGAGAAVGGGTATATITGTLDEEEAREAVFHRLESLGYRVGLGVVERFSRTTPRPSDPLSTIKFLCKDLWTLLFRKQIDNLKTNHRGIYVLTDNTFKPLTRMSFDTRKHYDPAVVAAGVATGDPALGREANSMARVQPFLYFPAGLVRGCLAGLGVTATVTAESSGLPAATFQIRTVGAKA